MKYFWSLKMFALQWKTKVELRKTTALLFLLSSVIILFIYGPGSTQRKSLMTIRIPGIASKRGSSLLESFFPRDKNYLMDLEQLEWGKGSLEKIHERRLRYLREFCQHFELPKSRDRAKGLTLYRDFPVFECRIPKTGTSTRAAIVWPLFHNNSPLWQHLSHSFDPFVPRTNFQNWTVQYSQQYPFGFMFVREPFERAISGFLNKRAVMEKKLNKNFSANEFFQLLIDDRIDDYHFLQQYKSCNPCKLNISFLGRTESMAADFEFLIDEKTGLHRSIKFNSSSEFYSNVTLKKTVDEEKKLIYSELSRKMVERFLWAYRWDYLAFGYNPYRVLDRFTS